MKIAALIFCLIVSSLGSAAGSARAGLSVPYTGVKSDPFVGLFGGTGCSRHWDFLDAHDSSLKQPYDRCGAYLLVSAVHHKWVDSRVYAPTSNWWDVVPLKGDGILSVATCSSQVGQAVYVLKQYSECGGPSVTIAYCDEQGRAVSSALASQCRE